VSTPLWEVKIQFDDGEHIGYCRNDSQSIAYSMVLQDARMWSPGQTFYGKVLGYEIRQRAE